jgi:hypothetical protein
MVLLRGESILIRPIVPCAVTSVKSGFQANNYGNLYFHDASKMTSEALFEQGWNSRVMPHGGRREARKFVTRGIHLGARLPANFGLLNHNRRLAGEPSEPSAKLATEYALTIGKYVAYGGSAGAA